MDKRIRDKQLVCVDCKQSFFFTPEEQAYCQNKQLSVPKRSSAYRKRRKANLVPDYSGGYLCSIFTLWGVMKYESLSMTIPEVAKSLGISRGMCYTLARRGLLPVPVINLGEKRMVVSRLALNRLLVGDDSVRLAGKSRNLEYSGNFRGVADVLAQ